MASSNKSNFTTISLVIVLLFFTTILNHTAYGAGEVDPNFNSSLTIRGRQLQPAGTGLQALVLPDGKILVGGRFGGVNGYAINNIVRLNSDGTLDETFRPPQLERDGKRVTVFKIALQSNGKILVIGQFLTADGLDRPSLIRLNSDGSLDMSFPQWFDSEVSQNINELYVYPDDRILIAGEFTTNATGGNQSNLARFNSDGSADSSFSYNAAIVTSFTVQADNKIVIGRAIPSGQGYLGNVVRLNSDGSRDSFPEISIQFNRRVYQLEYQTDGKILVGGNFETVNGSERKWLFRANSDGTIDESFQSPQVTDRIILIKSAPNGKSYIVFQYQSYRRWTQRINSDGSWDNTYPSYAGRDIRDIIVQTDGKVLLLENREIFVGTEGFLTRLLPNGALDPGFSSPFYGTPGIGRAIKIQPDNKILVGGLFNRVGDSFYSGLTRFNPDGTVDSSFLGSVGLGAQVSGIDLQPDGKILISGLDMGDARRLRSNGIIDISFPDTPATNDIKYLQDGKILIGGLSLRRHNADGTLDTTLATISGLNVATIFKLAVQPDGKIIVVGSFNEVNGATHNQITRLNPDGTFDTSFNPTGGANSAIISVALQNDGKILIGGSFTSFNNDPNRKYLARLNSDGSIDTSFSIDLNSPVYDIKIQNDNKIIIGGSMNSVNGQVKSGITRINSDGTLDTTFNTGTGTNSTVWSLAQQTDGHIVYGGQFSRTNGIETIGIGRLLNATTPTKTLFDYDGDGRADVSVFRPSTNRWYELLSSNASVTEQTFGASGDIVTPGDYDGDGKTDIGIFRPSSGTWWYQSSINNAQVATQWGQAGDIPRPSDFDGDGKTDFVIFRPTENNWYRYGSTQGESIVNFGTSGDKPVVGDFDGDGKSDVAIYRPSTGDWWYQSSINNAQLAIHWGISTDIPVPADFDGDGKTDLAVYRPSTGIWYIYNSSNASITIINFGLEEDKPVPADYDGDGKADIAVFRPSTGIWYLLNSTSGFSALQFGISTDTPTPNAFVP